MVLPSWANQVQRCALRKLIVSTSVLLLRAHVAYTSAVVSPDANLRSKELCTFLRTYRIATMRVAWGQEWPSFSRKTPTATAKAVTLYEVARVVASLERT